MNRPRRGHGRRRDLESDRAYRLLGTGYLFLTALAVLGLTLALA
jgi:hypothetical protein